MSARGSPARNKVPKQNQYHHRLKIAVNDKSNPFPTQSYKNLRLNYLQTLYSNRCTKFVETDSAEDTPTDTEVRVDPCTKPINKVISEIKLDSLYTPPQTRISTTAKKPNTAITPNNISTFYTCGGRNKYNKQKPQLPIYSDYHDDGNYCVGSQQCDCTTNNRPIPERKLDPRHRPSSYEESCNESGLCEWCLREEARRRQDEMRQVNRQCSCSKGLQGLQYSPSVRPPSRWRPPSRFGPRPERCCEPFIPYSHRHDSKYHRHCIDPEVRGQERHGAEDPWVTQPVRYRRTVPSRHCAPPPTCCRNLPILRRSTIPSRTDIHYR